MAPKKCVNPLFEEWLLKWKNDADKVGSNMRFVYGKAVRSLREHDQILKSGDDCRILKGFGEKICKRINDKLREEGLLIEEVEVGEDEVGEDEDELNFASTQSDEELLLPAFTAIKATSTTPKQLKQSSLTDLLRKKKRPHLSVATPTKISPFRKMPKTKSNRKYIPAYNSASFGILIALYKAEQDDREELGKEELKMEAQRFTETSMFNPGSQGSFYTGFNSIKTLVNKGLVERKQCRFASYSLSDDGRATAETCYRIYCEKQGIEPDQGTGGGSNSTNTRTNICNAVLWSESEEDDDVVMIQDNQPLKHTSKSASQSHPQPFTLPSSSSQSSTTSSLSSQPVPLFSFPPNTFDIVLCIDIREQIKGVAKNMSKTALMSQLQQGGIRVEMRTLPVSDFAWIAQERSTSRFKRELVLDVIVERKTIDDLAHSIKDGRWHEQMHRLSKCGIRKPAYLIENWPKVKNTVSGLKFEVLQQAVVNAQMDGFMIKRCEKGEDTLRYLTLMTRYMNEFYKDRTLQSVTRDHLIKNPFLDVNHLMSFEQFGKCSNKITNFTVGEMFLKHLLQIRGVSLIKAKLITELYPTLHSLLDAYEICNTEKERENLLADLRYGKMERKFGPNLSKKIYQYYSY